MSRDSKLEGLPDESLVLLHQADPQGAAGREALALLITRWSSRTYLWAYRFVREREEALDLSQDCMVQMIEALPRYQARGKFSAWLFTIVHHRCLDLVRRRRRAPAVDVDLTLLAAKETGPEAWVEQNRDRERVIAAMRDHLEPVERMALWLRAYEETSVEDITRMLNLDGASGARGLLQTARRKLKAALTHLENERGGQG